MYQDPNLPTGVKQSDLEPIEPKASDPYQDTGELESDLESLRDYLRTLNKKDVVPERTYIIQEIEFILSRLDAYHND